MFGSDLPFLAPGSDLLIAFGRVILPLGCHDQL